MRGVKFVLRRKPGSGALRVSAAATSIVLCACASVASGSPASTADGAPLSLGSLYPLTIPRPPQRTPYSLREAAADRPDASSQRRLAGPPPGAPIPAGAWKSLGPAPTGPSFLAGGGFYGGVSSGRITGLAAVPSGLHPGRVVAATAGGGIWTSDDNGAHWEARSDGASDLAIGSIVDDPSNPNHLIAGTGEANQSADSYPGAGILVSTDGGQSWSLQNPGSVFSGHDIAQVAIDPSNSSHEFAATTAGLFVTTNGGTSWAKPTDSSYASLDGNISAVVIDPTTPTTVYLGGGPKVVGKSTDGGVHWAAANSGITVPSPSASPLTALAIAHSSTSTLYASVGTITGAVALYKTENGGSSWTSVTAAPDYTGGGYSYEGTTGGGEQGWYDNTVAIDPTNASHVLAGGIAAVETKDGGATWTNVNGQAFFGGGTNKLHPDHHALAFRSDGKVWIGDDGGVFLYTPSSGAVENANGNLNITQLYFGFNAVSGTVLAGSQDNGSARTSSGLAVPWTGIWTGDGGPSAITPNETATQFVQADQNLYITSDAFASESSPRNITPPELGLFTPPTIVVPSTATPTNPTVFYGGVDLWRTTNPSAESPTWTKVTSVARTVSAIAASSTNPNIVYVGFTNGVIQVSTDGGATFTSTAFEPTSEVFVTGLSVNPSNPKEIAASFSFNDTRFQPGLPHAALYSYTTTPGSGTWSVITGNLPAFAISRVVYDNGALVAATDQGVYATSAPAGESTLWERVGTEMPNVQVQDLDVEPDGLYAVTHGRGAWRLSTLPTISGFTPASGIAGVTVVTITGASLAGATAVRFNGTPASISSDTTTEIKATVPIGATSGKITVTTPAGTATSASSFASSDPYRDAVSSTAGLVSYWRLDEGSGTTANDVTGAHPGIYKGTVTLAQPGALSGIPDTAAAFDGSSGYVSLPPLGSSSTFTVEGWTKLNSSASSAPSGNNELFGQSNSERLIVRPTGIYADVFLGGHKTGVLQATTPSNINTWVYWTLVRNGTTLTIYRNGTAVTSTNTLPSEPSPLSGTIGGSYFLHGNADEVAIYNQPLSTATIQSHYHVALSDPYRDAVSSTAGLVSYWRLDEGSGTTANDVTGAHPGTYKGTVTLTQPGALTGIPDTAAGFDGSSGYVSLPPLGSSSTFTVEGWTKLNSSASSAPYGNNELFGQGNSERLIVRPTGVYADVYLAGHQTGVLQITTPSNINTWVYWTLVRNSTTLTIYRNGAAVASTNTLPSEPSPLNGTIGGTYYFLHGNADEIAIYNQALPTATIQSHYHTAGY